MLPVHLGCVTLWPYQQPRRLSWSLFLFVEFLDRWTLNDGSAGLHVCVFSIAALHKQRCFWYLQSCSSLVTPEPLLLSCIYGFVLFTFLAPLPRAPRSRKTHSSEQMISSVYSKSFEARDMRVQPNIVKRHPTASLSMCECISVFLWGIHKSFRWIYDPWSWRRKRSVFVTRLAWCRYCLMFTFATAQTLQ